MLNILKNNSLFIINKLNLFDSEERRSILNNIIEKTSLEFKVEIKLNKNCFEINAKAKNLEVSKFENFLNYYNLFSPKTPRLPLIIISLHLLLNSLFITY